MRYLVLLLMVFALPASAEWVRYGGSDESNPYYDPATIRVNGHLRRVWTIQDLKRREPEGYMSFRSLVEYDCREERNRVLSFSAHPEPMAGGRIMVSSDSPGQWKYIVPESIGQALLKILCK